MSQSGDSSKTETVDHCLYCGNSPDHAIRRESGEHYALCRRCWTARHENDLEVELATVGLLTPKVVSELQAGLYDLAEPRDGPPMTESVGAFLSGGAHTTTVRLGTGTDLAYHAGIAGREVEYYGDSVAWPDTDEATDSFYTVAVYPPLDADIPLRAGAFAAAETVEELDEALYQIGYSLKSPVGEVEVPDGS